MSHERLKELAGVLNESGFVRNIGTSLAEELIRNATEMVKPAYRNDKRKVEEYVQELMAAMHDYLESKGFQPAPPSHETE